MMSFIIYRKSINKYRFAILFLLFSILCISQNISRKEFNKSGVVEFEQQPFSIPFDYNQIIFIDVKIEGKDYKFLFDTYASVSLISESVLHDIKGYTEMNRKKKIYTSNGTYKFKTVLIDTFSIAGISFKDFYFNVGTDFFKGYENSFTFDGIIGFNVINKFDNFSINYDKEIITINNLNKDFIPDYEFDIVQGSPPKFIGIESKVDSIPMNRKNYGNLAIDTGNGVGIKFCKNKKIRTLSKSRKNFINSDSIIIELYGPVSGIQDRNYNSLIIDYVDYLYDDNLIFSILGNDFLDDYISYFDLVRNDLFLKKQEKEMIYFDDFYFLRDKNTGKFYITIVKTDSELYRKGLRPHSEIISINDITLTKEMKKYDIDKIINRGKFKKIKIKDNEGLKNIYN